MSDRIRSALQQSLERLRTQRTVIHHVSNYVTLNDCANAALAVGGSPIMAHSIDEVEEITAGSSSVVLNMGTPDPQRIRAIIGAGQAASRAGVPIVFDPVGIASSQRRRQWAQDILAAVQPTVIRANAREILALAGPGADIVGVDAGSAHVPGADDLLALQRMLGAVLMITGPADTVVDGHALAAIDHGSPLLTSITGTGCMLNTVTAAFLAVEKDTMAACTAASAFYGLAAERAAARIQGRRLPGSFKGHFLDELAQGLDNPDTSQLRIEIKGSGSV